MSRRAKELAAERLESWGPAQAQMRTLMCSHGLCLKQSMRSCGRKLLLIITKSVLCRVIFSNLMRY